MSELRYLNFRRPMGWVGPPFTDSEYVVGSFACHVSWAEHAASHIIIVGDYGSVNDVEYIDMREGA